MKSNSPVFDSDRGFIFSVFWSLFFVCMFSVFCFCYCSVCVFVNGFMKLISLLCVCVLFMKLISLPCVCVCVCVLLLKNLIFMHTNAERCKYPEK